MPRINVLGYRIGVPRNPLLRVLLGTGMVVGGLLDFCQFSAIGWCPWGWRSSPSTFRLCGACTGG